MTDAQLDALPFSQWSQVFDAQEQAVLAYADSVIRGASATREETLRCERISVKTKLWK